MQQTFNCPDGRVIIEHTADKVEGAHVVKIICRGTEKPHRYSVIGNLWFLVNAHKFKVIGAFAYHQACSISIGNECLPVRDLSTTNHNYGYGLCWLIALVQHRPERRRWVYFQNKRDHHSNIPTIKLVCSMFQPALLTGEFRRRVLTFVYVPSKERRMAILFINSLSFLPFQPHGF